MGVVVKEGTTQTQPISYLATLRAMLHTGEPTQPLAVGVLAIAVATVLGIGVASVGPAVVLALVLGMAIGLVLITDPAYLLWVVLAVIILLPFATLPIDIGVTPTLLEIAVIGSLVVAVLRQTQGARSEIFCSQVGWFLLIFVGLAVASFVLGIAHARPSVTTARRFADMILSLSLFYVTVNVLHEDATILRTHKVFLLLGGLAALIGVGLYFLPQWLSERLLVRLGAFGYPTEGVLRFVEDNPALPMRAIGTSVDPNVFGGLLAFVGGLAIPETFVQRGLRRTWVVWILLLCVLAALLLTFSRGSMFGLACAAAVLGVVRHRRLLVVLLVGCLLILILPPTQAYVQHFIEGVRGQDLATQMRFGEYKDALLLISRYPWFGVGFTGTPDVDIYIGVSSVYLLIAEEMGLVGLAAFLLTMIAFFAYTWQRAKLARGRDPQLESLILGSQTAVLAGLVAGVLDHYLFNLAFPHAAALLWLTIGLGVAGAREAALRFGAGSDCQ